MQKITRLEALVALERERERESYSLVKEKMIERVKTNKAKIYETIGY